MKATREPAAAGAMLYHSMLTQVSTWPTSFHQLYSTMKLARVLIEPRMSANSTASRISLRICEGRIRTRISLLETLVGCNHTSVRLLLRHSRRRYWWTLCPARLGAGQLQQRSP